MISLLAKERHFIASLECHPLTPIAAFPNLESGALDSPFFFKRLRSGFISVSRGLTSFIPLPLY